MSPEPTPEQSLLPDGDSHPAQASLSALCPRVQLGDPSKASWNPSPGLFCLPCLPDHIPLNVDTGPALELPCLIA